MPPDTSQTDTDAQVAAEERRSGFRTIRRVAPYLWPDGEAWVKRRVVLSIGLLVLAKLIAVGTPLFYKGAVDALTEGEVTPAWALGAGAVALTVAYGLARLMNTGFQQLRDGVFARVGQRALRQIALETFEHVHRLSLRYHITRRTGGLSRIIERGVKGVEFLLRFLLFSIGPLVLELLLIAGVLFFLFDPRYLLVVAVTIAGYVWFTFKVTEWRVKLRREMNTQDTDANQKAIDLLLNFETVKYFGAERREAERYDLSMRAYERAAVKTQVSLAALNFGQAFLITAGLVIVMVMAAQGVAAGQLTVGDFVMVNAYMIQITMPLNFLGTVYREIRQSLVDMGSMFDLLDQPAEVSDKPGAPDLAVSRGVVEFDDIRFGYDPERPILKGVSLRVGAGESVALVGPVGVGQVDDRAAALPVLRRAGRGDPDRRTGLAGRPPGERARRDRGGAAGHCALQRHDPLQHRLWPRGGRAGRDRGGGARGADPRFHREPARGIRDAGGRARAEALGRREAAGRDRADAAEGPADPAARRGDLGPRHRDRGGDPGRAGAGCGGAVGADHRAPPLDHRGCGPDRRARSGRGGRGGHPCAAARAHGALCRALGAASGGTRGRGVTARESLRAGIVGRSPQEEARGRRVSRKDYPETPDGRYFVAKGRMWRKTDPRLGDSERRAAVKALMQARRGVGQAAGEGDEPAARDAVDAAKRRLGERGPVWWDDGAPDEGGKHPSNTSYAEWWDGLDPAARERGS